MPEYVVLILVIGLGLGAHVWIVLWIRFKVHEGAILKHLGDTPHANTIDAIAADTRLAPKRVLAVCVHSDAVTESLPGRWRLTGANPPAPGNPGT